MAERRREGHSRLKNRIQRPTHSAREKLSFVLLMTVIIISSSRDSPVRSLLNRTLVCSSARSPRICRRFVVNALIYLFSFIFVSFSYFFFVGQRLLHSARFGRALLALCVVTWLAVGRRCLNKFNKCCSTSSARRARGERPANASACRHFSLSFPLSRHFPSRMLFTLSLNADPCVHMHRTHLYALTIATESMSIICSPVAMRFFFFPPLALVHRPCTFNLFALRRCLRHIASEDTRALTFAGEMTIDNDVRSDEDSDHLYVFSISCARSGSGSLSQSLFPLRK